MDIYDRGIVDQKVIKLGWKKETEANLCWLGSNLGGYGIVILRQIAGKTVDIVEISFDDIKSICNGIGKIEEKYKSKE